MIAHARVLRAKGHHETSLIETKKFHAVLVKRSRDRPGVVVAACGHPRRIASVLLLEFLLSSHKSGVEQPEGEKRFDLYARFSSVHNLTAHLMLDVA